MGGCGELARRLGRLRLPISNAIINTKTTITATVTQVGNALCDGFTLFVMLDVVGVVTELVDVFTELVVVATLTVVVVVVVDWFVGCGNGCIAMYIEPWPFVVFTSPNHVRYSVLSMIDALGIIVNAVV